jgi:glucosamine--fructose-6-phosphate aminotransferase (isomerizing)
VSIYNRPLFLKDQLFLAISQSGQSDDLVAMARSARAEGAITVAITNTVDSPLSTTCDHVIPICAGPELSVAATKTFVATAAALARLVAAWAPNETLTSALDRLPKRLADAAALDWTAALPVLANAASLVTIGRGPTLGIAREAALKLKELCNRHAEAFSGAEFLHGPVALVSFRYPVLMFMPADAAISGMQRLATDLRLKGTALFVAGPCEEGHGLLPILPADHPETDAICLVQSFYTLIVQLADALRIDVDRPRHLEKITSTA